MDNERRRMEVTIRDKRTGEEKTFISMRKASLYMNISAMQLSRIIKGTRNNLTGYYVTTD